MKKFWGGKDRVVGFMVSIDHSLVFLQIGRICVGLIPNLQW